MSMNLRCDEIDLWQTPTWITRICLYDANGDFRPVTETTHIYMAWVKQHLNGVWKDQIIYDNMKTSVRQHVNEIKDAHIKEYYEL